MKNIYNLININSFNEDHDKSKDNTYVKFKLNNLIFAINITYVKEIISFTKVKKIPESPEYILGVINVRKTIIPIIDINYKFYEEKTDISDKSCIIILNYKEKMIGIIVKEIFNVSQIPESNLTFNDNQYKIYNKILKSCVSLNDETIIMLDIEDIINNLN